MLVTDVNSEVASVMTSIITDSGSGNEKIVIFGGLGADKLKICSSDPNAPEIVLNSPSLAVTVPIQFSTKTGYSSLITVD